MRTLLILLLLVVQAHAQLIMSFSGGNPLSVGPGTAGFSFTEGTLPQTIRSLGIWDESGAGLTASHAVGLWDFTTHALLASTVVVPATAVNIGGFWYASITPITLQPDHRYVLAAQYADVDFDLARGNVPTATTAGITLGDAMLSTGTGFSFPDLNVSLADRGFFGPNASSTAVPEPSQYALAFALFLVGVVVCRKREALMKALPILLIAASAHALTVDEATAIQTQVRAAAPPELPFVVARILRESRPIDRRAIERLIIRQVSKDRPGALPFALDAIAENRPPITPGNTHGKRPLVPPGLANYASP